MIKNKLKVLVALMLTLSLVLCTGCVKDLSTSGDVSDNSASQSDLDNSSKEPEPEPKPVYPPPAEVNVISVGDDLIHSSLYKQANARAGQADVYDWNFAYANIADEIAEADLATINQETMMSSLHGVSTYPQFNSPQSLGDHLISIGFDMFSIANNHMLDVYEKGLLSTIDYFQSKAPDVVYAGAYKSYEELMLPTTLERDGVVFGFVSMTQYTNGLSLPQGSATDYISTEETDVIKAKIEATKAVSDVVIVNVHWGNEYSYEPTQIQRDLASKMVEWGANVIIGHHPHVLQPIEYIEKEDGTHALIAYSLGNFISAQDKLPRMLGGMLNYTVTKDFETGVVDVINPSLDPIVTHYNNKFSDIRIFELSEYSEQMAIDHGIPMTLSDLNSLLRRIIPNEFLTDYNQKVGFVG